MRIKQSICLVIIFLFVVGCAESPEFVGINNVEIIDKTDTTIVSRLMIDISNPNSFDISTSVFEYNAFINDQEVGRGKATKEFILKKNSITSIENRAEINIKQILSVYDFIVQNDSFPLDMQLYAEFTSLKLKISDTYTIFLYPEEIITNIFNASLFKDSYSISEISVESVGLNTTNLLIKVFFYNNFPFICNINGMEIDLYESEEMKNKLGNSKLYDEVNILPGENKTLENTASLNNSKVSKSLISKMMMGNVSFYVNGTITVSIEGNKLEIPVSQHVDL